MKFKLISAIVLVLACVSISGVLAAGNNIELVSVSYYGTQGNSYSEKPCINSDGRYVAFYSYASNLVPNDTNNKYDVFVRDRQTNTTTLVSIASDGAQGNDDSWNPSISGDGRYVAFQSFSSNLIPNDTNGCFDIFVRDMKINTTARISISDNSTQGNSGSEKPCINSDGRYVAFYSYASNLVPNDTNNTHDVFVRDLQTNTTTLVSIASDGAQDNGISWNPSISGDGRYVAFNSRASNLVPNDTNNKSDVFVRDLQTNTTILVSIASDGAQGNDDSLNPSISGDGRYVTFQSDARNLVPNDTNNKSDVFVRDRQTNTTTLVSIASDGAQGNGISWNPSISGNGQYIAFESYATNFVPADTNPTVDIFVADNPLYERLPTSASVASATGTGMITVSTSYGGIQSLTAVSQDELLCISLPGNVSFPHGLLSFTIANIPPGSTVTLTITFPAPIPEDVQFWKCQNGTWIDCTSLVGDDDGDEVLTLTITDGGLGDSDGQINGEISDPSGPAIPATAPVPVPAPAPMQAPSTPRASPRLPNPAQMSVQYISINPQQVYANQPVTILTNVVNTGGEAGNYGLALKINGKVEQNKMVSVGPQGAQPVKFTVTKAQPGIYIVDIGGQKGSFTIIGASHNGGSTSSGGVIAIIIVSILILATIVVLLISRRPA